MARRPEPPLIILVGDVRLRGLRGLNTVALKALLNLSRFPGQAWGWMCSVFGTDIMQKLPHAGYINTEGRRGALVHLTPEGLEVLEEALQRSGARYFKQMCFGALEEAIVCTQT